MKLQRQFANGVDKPCTHVRVVHTGTTPEQNFSDRLVAAGRREGWIVIAGAVLTMTTHDGQPDLTYTIKRAPGYYVKSTGATIPVSAEAFGRMRWGGDSTDAQAEARAFLAGQGLDANDYEVTLAWECVLDSAQHDQFKLGA